MNTSMSSRLESCGVVVFYILLNDIFMSLMRGGIMERTFLLS